MHAGMYAAETIVEALKEDSVNFEAYDEKVHNSVIEKDLYRSRNMRQPLSKGLIVGGDLRQCDGRAPRATSPAATGSNEDDAEVEMEIGKAADGYPKPDNELTFNKLDSVFLSGNATRDDAPNHVRIQTRVPREIAQTWVSMCPAQVYEIPDEQLENGAAEVDVHVTASNCVQCGAIVYPPGGRLVPRGSAAARRGVRFPCCRRCCCCGRSRDGQCDGRSALIASADASPRPAWSSAFF